MRDKLYAMGLIETFCFIYTTGKDWWFVEDDMLLHMHGLSPKKYKIVTSNFVGSNKYR